MLIPASFVALLSFLFYLTVRQTLGPEANSIMGDAGASNVSSALNSVLTDFTSHSSGKRTNTEAAVLSAIRNAHSDSHVTPVSFRRCNLDGFAKAGHASIKLLTTHKENIWERTYSAPSSRLERSDGTIGTTYSFAQSSYQFRDNSYIVYTISWLEEMRGTVFNYYIVSPLSTLTQDNQHSTASDSLILHASKWTSELHNEIYVFDDGHWTKNSKLFESVQSSTWDDVILDPAMKQTLIQDVEGFFDSRAVYEEYSVPWKRGLIMHGKPGCGKTVSIKALMNSLDKRAEPVASLYVKSFDASNGMQYSIRTIFAQARKMAPCLLIFEDLDSLVKDEVRSYFLNEVDGLEDNNGVLMIGSTNHLDRLDPGISKRPSRFDRKYHYKLPGDKERVLYCQYWQQKLAQNSDLEFPDDLCPIVAQLTEGFSFAYMKELFVQCLLTIVGGRANVDDEEDDKDLETIAQKVEVTDDSSRLKAAGENIASNAPEGSASSASTIKIPEVEVPDHLKSNPLLRILRKQAAALLKEMDNTEEEGDGAKSKGKVGRGVRHSIIRGEEQGISIAYDSDDFDDDGGDPSRFEE